MVHYTEYSGRARLLPRIGLQYYTLPYARSSTTATASCLSRRRPLTKILWGLIILYALFYVFHVESETAEEDKALGERLGDATERDAFVIIGRGAEGNVRSAWEARVDNDSEEGKGVIMHIEEKKSSVMGNKNENSIGSTSVVNDGTSTSDKSADIFASDSKCNEDPTFIITLFIPTSDPNRVESLLSSLSQSNIHKLNYKVALHIHITHDSSNTNNAVYDTIQQLSWMHGPKKLHKYDTKYDIRKMIQSAWIPTSDLEFNIFLFPSATSVSPHYFTFVLSSLHSYLRPCFQRRDDENYLFGIALHPNDKLFTQEQKLLLPSTSFLHQTVPSHGMIVFPWMWREFIRFYRWREKLNPTVAQIVANNVFNMHVESMTKVNVAENVNEVDASTDDAWRRSLLDFVHLRGYAFFVPRWKDENGKALSLVSGTNDNEFEFDFKGTHFWKTAFPDLHSLPVIDITQTKVEDCLSLWRQAFVTYRNTIGKFGNEKSSYKKHFYNSWTHGSGFINRQECILDRGRVRLPDVSATTGDRLLIYQPQHGPNNQMMALLSAVKYAKLLNRTLVIPPRRIDNGKGKWIDWKETHDVSAFMKYHENSILWEDYIASIPKSDKTSADNTKYDIPRRLIRLSRPQSFLKDDDLLFREGGILSKDLPEVDFNDVLGMDDSEIISAYSQCNDKVLAFSRLFMGTDISRMESSILANYFTLNDRLENIVQKVMTFINSLDNGNNASVNGTNTYVSMHVRRGDFKEYCAFLEKEKNGPNPRSWVKQRFNYKECYPSKEDLVQKLEESGIFANNTNAVYVASNDPEEFDGKVGLPGYQVVTWRRLMKEIPDLNELDFDALGFIEQEICVRSTIFLGNPYSTWSRRIYETRRVAVDI